jgi:uncharacterized protein DUF4124
MRKLFLAGVLIVLPAAAAAQMYKCVDERGRTRYSDQPIPECKQEKALPKVQAAPPAAPPQGQAKRAAKPQAVAEDPQRLASRCKGLKEEEQWLMSPRGAAVEAHAARLGQVKQALRACP